MNRKLDCGEEARSVVGELELSIMKVSDRLDQRQPEPRSFVGAAGVEPAEPP
jgi:hypothetical protein